MARLFDCFPFFNELDLLEIRLNELSPVVDIFVIAEAPVTFQGRPKPLHFAEHRDRFRAFLPRIRTIVADLRPALHEPRGRVARERSAFAREHAQRNALLAGLADAAPDDLILLSDVDEIPRAASLAAAAADRRRDAAVHCFELAMFNYFVNLERPEPWLRRGPRLVRRRHLRSMRALRSVKGPAGTPGHDWVRWATASLAMGQPVSRVVHRSAGWHFTYLNGLAGVLEKLQAYSHVRDAIAFDPRIIGAQLAGALDGREHPGSDRLRLRPLDASFPAFLLANRDRFAALIADRPRLEALAAEAGREPLPAANIASGVAAAW